VKVPPNNLQAEQAVLGSILIDNAAFYDLPTGFNASDFYRVEHREVFTTIAGLIDAGKPADVLTVSQALTHAEAKAQPDYVVSLSDVVPSTARIGEYAGIVMDLALRRRLIHAYGETLEDASDLSIPTSDVQLSAEKRLSAVQDRRVRFTTARESAKSLVRDMSKLFDEGERPRGVTTGLELLDRELWVHPTDFVVVGGRPGDGKSVLLWQIARHVAKKLPVMVVSIEMNERELAQRAVMDYSDLSIGQVRLPRTQEEQKKYLEAAEVYAALDITFVPSRDAQTILREATRMKRKRGLGLLVIDYLQLVSLPREWGDNRDQRIGEFTGRIKAFSAEEGVPTLAASQLKRIQHLERGRDPRPTLEDLRESGNIEQDSNSVVLLYRPGVVEGTHENKAGNWRKAEAIIAKQRMGGARLSIPLVAHFEYSRFREPTEAESAEQEEAA